MDVALQQVWDTYGPLLMTALALAASFTLVAIGHRVLVRLGRRSALFRHMGQRVHKPAQLLVALVASRATVLATTDEGAWREPLLQAMLIAAIVAGGWLVASVLTTAEGTATARLRLDDPENGEARRQHTQLTVLRRVTVALVGVLTTGAVLYTFPAVRGLGTSLLASAGVLGVVAGLAAQSTLGNLIAGLQIAFGDRLRLEDIVVVEGEYGRVEEITLSYVVVRIWDQRRLVLPTSYFTTSPFVSWTRNDTEVLGTVELDLDWTVPVPQVRAELERFVQTHPSWDGRFVSLLVTEATGSTVRVRPLVSAADADKIWVLRCAVREHLVEWVRTHYPHALPRVRAEMSTSEPPPTPPPSRPVPEQPVGQVRDLPQGPGAE